MTNQPDTTVEVSMHAKSSDDLGYSLSGTGVFAEEKQPQGEGGGGAPAMGGSAGAPDNRPGGGLGKPGEEPDGLAKYRWYILVVLATVLVGGGIWTHERTVQEDASSAIAAAPSTVARTSVGSAATPAPVAAVPQPVASDLLLAALKEELFQLEVERQQGKLAPGEYEKARSAVEQTLQRALNRRSS